MSLEKFEQNRELLELLRNQEKRLIYKYSCVDVAKNPDFAYQLQSEIQAIRQQKNEVSLSIKEQFNDQWEKRNG